MPSSHYGFGNPTLHLCNGQCLLRTLGLSIMSRCPRQKAPLHLEAVRIPAGLRRKNLAFSVASLMNTEQDRPKEVWLLFLFNGINWPVFTIVNTCVCSHTHR